MQPGWLVRHPGLSIADQVLVVALQVSAARAAAMTNIVHHERAGADTVGAEGGAALTRRFAVSVDGAFCASPE
jgi:hypothetical protein